MKVFTSVVTIILAVQILLKILAFGSGYYPNNQEVTERHAAIRLLVMLLIFIWGFTLLIRT